MIDVVLATYNGAAYIRDQLDSLLAQDVEDIRIFVRDDKSTDATPAIIGHYADSQPGKFTLIPPDSRLGAKGNFATLLTYTDAKYVATCDQDDIWHTDKLSRSLHVMRELEAHYGESAPILVHGDAQMVDARAIELHPSFARAQKLAPEQALLNRLLVQNHVLGCTMLANRTLLNLALPIPYAARMHDHWLALVAAACGHTAYITEPLLYYRQHTNNEIGHQARGVRGMSEKVKRVQAENAEQARALLAALKGKLPGLSEYQIDQFIKITRLPKPARAGALLAGGYLRHPWWQNIAVLMFG